MSERPRKTVIVKTGGSSEDQPKKETPKTKPAK